MKTPYSGPNFYNMMEEFKKRGMSQDFYANSLRSASYPIEPVMNGKQYANYIRHLKLLIDFKKQLKAHIETWGVEASYQEDKQLRMTEELLQAYRDAHARENVPMPDVLQSGTHT